MAGSHRGRRSPHRGWRIAGVAGGAVALMSLGLVAPASSVDTTAATEGSWSFFSPQTYTDTTTHVAGPTAYKTVVRPPVNADGSSNFPAKRGVIPIQFDLLAAPTTTTTTTRTYDPPVWESINGVAWPEAGSVSYATFTPSNSLRFDQITNLSATYEFTEGDCYGGSLRWTIYTDNGNVHVYYGTPNGPDQGCKSATTTGSGDNLITTGITENRFEVQGAGAPVYTDYASVMAIVGADAQVEGVSLILDSGWSSTQRADISDVTVNDNTWAPKTSEVIETETTPGTFAKTCDLPDAKLQWGKADATPTGAVNEETSIQPKDDGVYFRHVDCKYIYNLAVSSLDGTGTYRVFANIGGSNLADPAVFDLR